MVCMGEVAPYEMSIVFQRWLIMKGKTLCETSILLLLHSMVSQEKIPPGLEWLYEKDPSLQ